MCIIGILCCANILAGTFTPVMDVIIAIIIVVLLIPVVVIATYIMKPYNE